jgi:hypothetical protein
MTPLIINIEKIIKNSYLKYKSNKDNEVKVNEVNNYIFPEPI